MEDLATFKAGGHTFCYEFDNEPADLAANDYLLAPGSDAENNCGAYGPDFQLVNGPVNLDPWFLREPSRHIEVAGVTTARHYCENPSPGYRVYDAAGGQWVTSLNGKVFGTPTSSGDVDATCYPAPSGGMVARRDILPDDPMATITPPPAIPPLPTATHDPSAARHRHKRRNQRSRRAKNSVARNTVAGAFKNSTVDIQRRTAILRRQGLSLGSSYLDVSMAFGVSQYPFESNCEFTTRLTRLSDNREDMRRSTD